MDDLQIQFVLRLKRAAARLAAVGRFTLSTSLDRGALQAGEPVTLTLKVEDLDGNADLARLQVRKSNHSFKTQAQLSPDPAPGKVDGKFEPSGEAFVRPSVSPSCPVCVCRTSMLKAVRGATVAEAIPVQVPAASQLDIEDLQ